MRIVLAPVDDPRIQAVWEHARVWGWGDIDIEEVRTLLGRIDAAMAKDPQSVSEWKTPDVPSGGQCVALDENGEECCAFHDYRTGKWYFCSNIVDPELAFTPRLWARLPWVKDPQP